MIVLYLNRRDAGGLGKVMSEFSMIGESSQRAEIRGQIERIPVLQNLAHIQFKT